jgi:hypothetical protein
MVDTVMFYGRAKELDRFLNIVSSNFNSHGHVFPCGGPDQLKYAISILDSWSNYQYHTLRQMAMTDCSEWTGNVSADSDLCLQYFNLFSPEMAKIYGEKDS